MTLAELLVCQGDDASKLALMDEILDCLKRNPDCAVCKLQVQANISAALCHLAATCTAEDMDGDAHVEEFCAMVRKLYAAIKEQHQQGLQ